MPLVLVADEDERIVQLLTIAFQASHFRVAVAHDGDEALRRAQVESPDLVVADVHLPRRGGLELCDLLRRDPKHGHVAILLLSSANDTESRVEGLSHGADGFMSKPFSPKELIARALRLATRSRDAARCARRTAELERDLGKLQKEALRARADADHEHSLRALAGGMLDELLCTLDLEELDAHLLRGVCRHTGARSAALLAADGTGALVTTAARGELFERWAGLSLPAAGSCVDWLCVLGRPIGRGELERQPAPPREVAELAAYGVSLLAALRTADGVLEAVVVCEDRGDGQPFTPEDRDRLATLCVAASSARATARRFRLQQDRVLSLLRAPASADPGCLEAASESRERLASAARSLGLTLPDRALLEKALELGPWAWTDRGRAAIESLAAAGPTRYTRQLGQLLDRAEAFACGEPGASPDALATLVAVGVRFQQLRTAGRSRYESWRTTVAWIGLHTDPLLRSSFPEAIEPPR